LRRLGRQLRFVVSSVDAHGYVTVLENGRHEVGLLLLREVAQCDELIKNALEVREIDEDGRVDTAGARHAEKTGGELPRHFCAVSVEIDVRCGEPCALPRAAFIRSIKDVADGAFTEDGGMGVRLVEDTVAMTHALHAGDVVAAAE
jgi:hypothetical protein